MLRTKSASDSFETLLIVLSSTLQVVCFVIMLYTVFEVFGRGVGDDGNATDSRVLLEAMIAKPMRQLDMV